MTSLKAWLDHLFAFAQVLVDPLDQEHFLALLALGNKHKGLSDLFVVVDDLADLGELMVESTGFPGQSYWFL